MEQKIFTVKSNKCIANNIFQMTLCGDTGAIARSGQFVNVKMEGLYLRRPISVCDYDNETLTLVYKTVGKGTKKMSELADGDKLDLLVGLGNGYDTSVPTDNALLVGGGVGVPPLYNLAKTLIRIGVNVTVLAGFHSKDDVFYEQEFSDLGCKTTVCVSDGSYGTKGRVTDVIDSFNFDYVFACGPESLLKAIDGKITVGAQYSFEQRMGCGFGACMCCSCKTKYGDKRICVDGPVLKREEVIW